MKPDYQFLTTKIISNKAASILAMLLISFNSHVIAQTISSISPTNGNVGSLITITGTGFNATPNNNIVFFGSTKATVSSASTTSLTAITPTGAMFAPISVLNTSTGLIARSIQFFNPTFSPNKDTITTNDIASKLDFTTATSPSAVAVGDIDGDGKPDVVTANSSNGPNISVLRNTSTSNTITFANKTDISISAQPYSIAISDLDGDGKLDIAIANQYSTVISVLRNTSSLGSISFATIADFSISSSYSGSLPFVSIGDVNGDSKPDLICISSAGNNTVSVLRNTSSIGAISFGTSIDFTTGNSPKSIALGDIDGDNKIDLAITNDGANTVSVLRNTSTTNNISFANKVDFSVETNPCSIAIGDLSGDGKLDLAIANFSFSSGGHNISILKNTSTTGVVSFANKVNIATGTNPSSICIGDINGDGKPDLAVTNRGNSTVSVLQNKGGIDTINFPTKVSKTTGSNPNSVMICDIDGDGKLDLTVANPTPNSVSIFRNTPLIPQITLTGNLSSFEACSGYASTQQSFTIKGNNLVSNVNISVPNGFEISKLPNTGFTSNISLVITYDSISSTNIYIRQSNSAIGNISGNIVCSSTWAVNQTIVVNGYVKSSSSSTSNLSICSSQLPYSWNGLTFDSASTKTKNGLINSVGCDSSATLVLSIKSNSSSTNNLSICPSLLPFTWNGLTFDSAGTKTKSGLVNSIGCDSSATLNLTLKPVSSSTNNLSICPSQLPFVWNGLTFDSAGTKTKSGLVNSIGCDSTATLNLSLFASPNTGNILGPKTSLLTSTSYTYTVNQQVGVTYNWSIQNGIIVSGQSTNQISVQFINAGVAKIQAKLTSINGCEDSSFIDLTIGSVGLNEVYLNNSVKIYPNPTRNNLVIEVESKLVGCEFIITDLHGKTVFQGKIVTVRDTINIEHLTNGLYFMKINAGIPPIKVLKL